MSKIARFSAVIVGLLLVLFLFSGCSTWLNLLSTLGFDSNDYDSEKVIQTLTTDGEEAQNILNDIRVLLHKTTELVPFESFTEAVEAYQDEVLLSLVRENFSRYSGNLTLMAKIEEDHPMMKCSIFVPAAEYESRMYTIFGGNWKLTNRSSTLFTYLEDYQGYVMITLFEQPSVKASIISLQETEHTYRVRFQTEWNDEIYRTYDSLLMKRKDGTLYFLYLRIAE